MRAIFGGSFIAIALLAGQHVADPAWLQDAAGIGLSTGAKAPGFDLIDQFGRKRSMASLMDRNGLVLIFFRSADW